jgi:hypothetical protein
MRGLGDEMIFCVRFFGELRSWFLLWFTLWFTQSNSLDKTM